jgi:hypothetical protein
VHEAALRLLAAVLVPLADSQPFRNQAVCLHAWRAGSQMRIKAVMNQVSSLSTCPPAHWASAVQVAVHEESMHLCSSC